MYTKADKVIKAVLPAGLTPEDALKINTNHEHVSWDSHTLHDPLPAPASDSFPIRASVVFPVDPDPPMFKPEHTVPEEGPSESGDVGVVSSTIIKKKKKRVKALPDFLPPPPEPEAT